MVDSKKTDKKPAPKSAATPKTSKTPKSVAAKDTVAKTNSAGTKKENKVNPPKAAKAAIAKAGASKESDMKAAVKKISDLDKNAADNAIRSKKSVNDLKSRAAEAKKRAQQKILEKAYVSDKPTDPLERLANTFDSSARRWEMVVYPSLFAFVLLAGYGFFLIYRLTHDIATLSQSVTHMAVIVSDAMPRMTKDMNMMTSSMDNMTGDIGGMTTEISSMSGQMNSLTPMSKNIQSMTHNIGSMNRSVYGMQRDMHGMNSTVSSGPFGMMNDVMPFSSDTNVPPPMAPQPTWPSYNPVPQQNYFQQRQQPRRIVAGPAVRNPMTANKTANKPAAVTKGKSVANKPAALPKSMKKELPLSATNPVAVKDAPVKSTPVNSSTVKSTPEKSGTFDFYNFKWD